MLKIDSKVSKRLYEILHSKAEKKVKIIEERYQKGENEETLMAEIQKLDEEKNRLVTSQHEMFEKKKLEPKMVVGWISQNLWALAVGIGDLYNH